MTNVLLKLILWVDGLIANVAKVRHAVRSLAAHQPELPC